VTITGQQNWTGGIMQDSGMTSNIIFNPGAIPVKNVNSDGIVRILSIDVGGTGGGQFDVLTASGAAPLTRRSYAASRALRNNVLPRALIHTSPRANSL
jgi:hypothetical protein